MQCLFKSRERAITGEDNLSNVQARMMPAARTKGRGTFLDNVVGQASTRVVFTL
jgi:hypothetical protein